MKNLLYITSSAQGVNSNSNLLSANILKKLLAVNPDTNLVTLDLAKNPLPYLEEATVNAFFTPVEYLTPEQKHTLKDSDSAIGELLAADIILIGVAMYNFGIPSTLKSWIDHIARAGVTFRYTASGPEGLVKNKKVYLAISSGGIYTEGYAKAFDFTEPYLKAMLNFLGVTDITVFRVEGTVIPDFKEQAIAKATESVEHYDFQLQA